MNDQTVFLVKFEKGYYAADQKGEYDWKFTPDPNLANQYKTRKKAQARVDWAKCLLNDGEPLNSEDPTHIAVKGKIEIEEWILRTRLLKV